MGAAFALPLFVPGDRPERFDKAVAAGSGTVILDLEDAVAPANKAQARQSVADYVLGKQGEAGASELFIRINALDTLWFEQDVAMLSQLPEAGVVLPKSETLESMQALRRQLGPSRPIWALIETAQGLANARALAAVVDRLVFGSIDFCADLALAHTDEVLAPYRAELVLAARLAGKSAPIDGVTTAIDQPETVQRDAARACAAGFAGKLLIHPRQIDPARKGFQPSSAEIDKARSVLATGEGQGAQVLHGQMIDKPVLDRARLTIARWEAMQ